MMELQIRVLKTCPLPCDPLFSFQAGISGGQWFAQGLIQNSLTSDTFPIYCDKYPFGNIWSFITCPSQKRTDIPNYLLMRTLIAKVFFFFAHRTMISSGFKISRKPHEILEIWSVGGIWRGEISSGSANHNACIVQIYYFK